MVRNQHTLRCLIVITSLAASIDGYAHTSPVGVTEIDGWSMPNIARVITAGYPDTLGLYAFPRFGFPSVQEIDGRSCIVGSAVGFDVDDDFAFDIDENVELEVLVHRKQTLGFLYAYDRNALAEFTESVTVPREDSVWHRETLVLERARFANRGMGRSDILLVAPGALWPAPKDETNLMAICGIALKRSHTTAKPEGYGRVDLEFFAPDGKTRTPVRVGIYDASGRMPLPSDDALTVKIYDESFKHLVLRKGPNAQYWPAGNRHVFYADGRYRATLPAGTYDLVVAKGPEYQIVQQHFTVEANETFKNSTTVSRWDNMPKKGWYSGDVHIHISREADENEFISGFLAAEDVHVSNLLTMNNTANQHFEQYAWGKAGQFQRGLHTIISGIESPRTAHIGHTISVNIEEPITGKQEYFHYHKAFAEYARQGALSGFAHLGLDEFSEWRGLALEVPFGEVDFVEVMQNSTLNTELWYDFLNLGFQLTPVSGSDFPYFDQPGSVRSYVQVDGRYNPQKWYDGLEAGRAFVTNGPILTFSVNKSEMGSQIEVDHNDALTIRATAHTNPDFDLLDRIELVMHGEVIDQVRSHVGTESLTLQSEIKAAHGMWLAVRAYGKRRGLAHTAPIYIHVGEQGSWSAAKAPAALVRIHSWLDELAEAPIVIEHELEFWEVGNIGLLWEQQKPDVLERIQEARRRYATLKKKIKTSSGNAEEE